MWADVLWKIRGTAPQAEEGQDSKEKISVVQTIALAQQSNNGKSSLG